MLRWPGRIEAGSVSNQIVQHHDWLPTFLAAAGDPDIVDKLQGGHQAAGKTFKVHIDGYNLLPYLTGQTDKSPRPGFIYFDDDGDLVALRWPPSNSSHPARRQPASPSTKPSKK
jgi:arylsulfatase A-like enzyme